MNADEGGWWRVGGWEPYNAYGHGVPCPNNELPTQSIQGDEHQGNRGGATYPHLSNAWVEDSNWVVIRDDQGQVAKVVEATLRLAFI